MENDRKPDGYDINDVHRPLPPGEADIRYIPLRTGK